MGNLSDRDLESLAAELEALRERNERLTDRVESLEDELDRSTDCVDDLESENEALREETDRLRDRVDDLEAETARTGAAVDAAHRRSGANKARIEELQSRELEKGAHLRGENVDHCEIEVDGDHLEKIEKDDGMTYVRLPDADDPLGRGGNVSLAHGGNVSLAHGDLLPIQQLARMDDDMLRSTTNALPSRLAAQLWNARTDPTVGDDPWRSGCKTVREYVKASDLKHWIRRQEPGTSDAYAKKLVSRTIDALLDLSKNRLAIRRKRERKNGLEYTERRVLLSTDADIPGETGSGGSGTASAPPETTAVHGGD